MTNIVPGYSIIIPAYNEEVGVLKVIEGLESVLRDSDLRFEIIVVDDGSTDRTVDIVKRTNAVLIEQPYNMGYGAALKTGVRHSEFERVVIIDADGTYPPEALPKLLVDSSKFDMVVGARTGEDVHIPMIRRPAKWLLTKLAAFLAGRTIPDLNSGLRVFKKDSLTTFINLLPDGFSFTTTVTLAMITSSYAVKYVPINYMMRKGKSKIRPVRDTLGFVSLIVRIVLYFNPLKVLLPLAMIMFTIDFAKIIFDIVTYNWHIATSTIMLAIVAFNTLIIALIADMIASLRKSEARQFLSE